MLNAVKELILIILSEVVSVVCSVERELFLNFLVLSCLNVLKGLSFKCRYKYCQLDLCVFVKGT